MSDNNIRKRIYKNNLMQQFVNTIMPVPRQSSTVITSFRVSCQAFRMAVIPDLSAAADKIGNPESGKNYLLDSRLRGNDRKGT
jgi:hypothetical protein